MQMILNSSSADQTDQHDVCQSEEEKMEEELGNSFII